MRGQQSQSLGEPKAKAMAKGVAREAAAGAVARGDRLIDQHDPLRGMMRRAYLGDALRRAGCGLQPYMGMNG